MSAAIMAPISTSTLPPIRPSGLSRSTATYYSSSSLPPSSLDSWSLDHSCTTFGRAVEAAKATTVPQHRRSSRLIDEDPDINEEEHMRGIKRNRHSMTKSPATKRRCGPFGGASSSSCDASSSEAFLLASSASSSKAYRRTISLSGTSNHDQSALYKSDKSFHLETNHDSDDDDDDEDEATMPAPPIFRRRSTIKDPFDLASSMEEFKHLI